MGDNKILYNVSIKSLADFYLHWDLNPKPNVIQLEAQAASPLGRVLYFFDHACRFVNTIKDYKFSCLKLFNMICFFKQ